MLLVLWHTMAAAALAALACARSCVPTQSAAAAALLAAQHHSAAWWAWPRQQQQHDGATPLPLPRRYSSTSHAEHHRRGGHGAASDSSSTTTTTEGDGGLQVTVEPLSGAHEGVSVLSLNRPGARNALGRQMVRELSEALETLRQERTTRCVLLRSAVPGCFSAGADLKERAAMTAAEAGECVAALRALMGAVAALPMPTVAVLEGYALGGGAELALACDVRVAARGSASLAFPEARLGIIPGAGGTQRLPRLAGRAAAKELIFTGRRVGADEAAALRLVEHAVDEGRAMARALEIAADIAQVRALGVERAAVCTCTLSAV